MTTPAPPPADPTDLDQRLVTALLAASDLPWRDVTVVPTTGSTNADLIARLSAGEAGEGSVIAAGEQTAGRGRHGRDWQSPPGTTLSFSLALTPPAARADFVPVLTALALERALRGLSDVDVSLKWPNDVLVGEGKVAGILAEGAGGAVVVGCGVNVSVPAADLPVPSATSLALHGADLDRSRLLVTALEQVHAAHELWREAGYSAVGSGLLDAYRASCTTLGRAVRVELPAGETFEGTAEEVDDDGRLVVATAAGRRTVTAADVHHLRSV